MNSLRGKGLAILTIYCAKTMKPAREGWFFSDVEYESRTWDSGRGWRLFHDVFMDPSWGGARVPTEIRIPCRS